jgi:hypothetical protein
MQRAGRIGGNEFDLQAAADALALRCATTVVGAGGEHGATTAQRAAGVSVKLMKPAPATSTLATMGRRRQFAHQALGDLARIGLQLARQLHRQVAGEVAVAGLLRAFEDRISARPWAGATLASAARSRPARCWRASKAEAGGTLGRSWGFAKSLRGVAGVSNEA